jgi:hypothetical protein
MPIKTMLCLGLLMVSVAIPLTDAQQTSQTFDLYAALSRIPQGEWETVAYTDLTATMRDLGETWLPSEARLTPLQEAAWVGVWRPNVLSLDLAAIAIQPYHLERMVEARQGNNFVLWLEGQFQVDEVGVALGRIGYQPLDNFPAEAYRATSEDNWQRFIPYISLPDGHTLIIASSPDYLRATLDVYDGLSSGVITNDELLPWLSDLSASVTSGVVRFQQTSQGCPLDASRLVAHGLRFDAASQQWQYVLHVVFPSEITLNDIRPLAEGLEYSTHRIAVYNGVMGQHTHIIAQNVFEGESGSIVQFILNLRPDPNMQHLPIELAPEPDTCLLFKTPPASASTLALAYLPDLSAGRVDMMIRYGNSEQALYNAGLNEPLTDLSLQLTDTQQVSLNSTWRTALAYESKFDDWFGFSPNRIRQAVEVTLDRGEYTRVLWGDFTTDEVETALEKTGFVAVEQYLGTRVFILRDAPASGGLLLSNLTQTAASPEDGVLVFANTIANLRVSLDILNQDFRSPLLRVRELVVMTRALGDATNVTLRRTVNPRSGGLVCGLPPYKVESFANVRRPDGWHFLYGIGSNRPWENAEGVAAALGETLENSDYPLQGPGSATLGQLAAVAGTEVIQEADAAVILVDLLVDAPDQQASFLGQDLAQATLPPCAWGDITQ